MKSLYLCIGKSVGNLSAKVKEAGWGSKVISSIADELKDKYPGLKGFNRPGLYRMMQFYDTYKDAEIVSTLLRQIGWSSHRVVEKVLLVCYQIRKKVLSGKGFWQRILSHHIV